VLISDQRRSSTKKCLLCPGGENHSSLAAIKNNADTDSVNSFRLIRQLEQPVMPDDHSKVVPLLPIPNRTVKRLSADDSADSRVKVGHRQALIPPLSPHITRYGGFWVVGI
jgi:hypothetical protein